MSDCTGLNTINSPLLKEYLLVRVAWGQRHSCDYCFITSTGHYFLGTSCPKKQLYVALPLRYWNGMTHVKEIQNQVVLKAVCFYCESWSLGSVSVKLGIAKPTRCSSKIPRRWTQKLSKTENVDTCITVWLQQFISSQELILDLWKSSALNSVLLELDYQQQSKLT